MSVIGFKLIKNVEKQLSTFQKYSFNYYSRLMLILVNYKQFLAEEVTLKNKQVQTDLVFEIQEEIESLQNIRYVTDKYQSFKIHVETALAITQKIELHLPPVHKKARHQRIMVLDLLRRFFMVNLKHS